MGGGSGESHSGHGKAAAYPDRYPNSCQFRIPDWRIYKVDGVPEVEAHRSKLANQGLRDPWIRNQVWLHDPKLGAYSHIRLIARTAFGGLRYAAVAFITCTMTEMIMEKLFPPFHGHIHLYNPDAPHSHSDDHHGHH